MSGTTPPSHPVSPTAENATALPALAALAGFAQSMVPPLLILALREAGREEAGPAVRQLASTLRELEAVAGARARDPALCGAAIRRLFGTLAREG